MNHLSLQTDPMPPTAAQLKEAFREVKGLTAVDAAKVARQAYGILVRGLSAQDARTLQQSLRGQSVGTEMFPEAQVPALPEPKYSRRLELQLVRMLMQRAPHAWLNRGATHLRENVPLPQLYASKAAFTDESVWILWRASRALGGEPRCP